MPIGSPQWMYASGEAYTVDQSLKFAQNRGTTLTRTATQASTNNKIGTWSFWIKKTETIDNNEQVVFQSRNANNSAGHTMCEFHYDNYEHSLVFAVNYSGGNAALLITKAQYRDPSAWMHIVIAYDSTQSTASDRVNIYINGEKITDFYTETYPDQNRVLERWGEVGKPNNIGSTPRTSNRAYLDGYLAEFHYVDGQQLTQADFGETGDYGEWKPIEYSGTYGNNGFYLPFKNDYSVEGFNTVTYKGTNADQYIGGTGFKPDLTWLKRRDSSAGHMLYDSIRGVGKSLSSQSTGGENVSNGGSDLTAFNTDGFSLGPVHQGNSTNVSGGSIVAWNWDMGADTPTGFSAVTYTGNAADGREISGVGFQPDLVWLKSRSDADHHYLQDSVRGAQKQLTASDTTAESSYTNGVKSFTPDGFTLGTSNWANENTQTRVAWCWDMGGTTAANTDGTINSTVMANTTYGQSIVSFTGNGTNGATVGHGLSSAPELVWVANRDDAHNNSVWHTSIPNTHYLHLDQTSASAENTAYWNSTSPDNSVFTLGTSNDINGSSDNMIAYCFHSVSGYSKFGTYSGDSTTNHSNSVTLGFRPAFLMVKKTSGTGNWVMVDNVRNPMSNDVDKYVKADTTDAEATQSGELFKFTSTGFTIGANLGDVNASGATYVYMAFAGGMDSISDYNTDGQLDSRVKANTTYGQSIVSYTGNATAGATVGHGLSSAPEMIILKDRDGTTNWNVYHASNTSAPETEALALNTTDATSDYLWWNDTAPTSSVFSLGAISNTNANGNKFIAYCWHSVSNYSSIGSFLGTGSATAINVTTGFEPAWLLLRVADASSGRDWYIYDNVRGEDKYLSPNTDVNPAEVTDSTPDIEFTANGFSVTTTNDEVNSSGDTTIYMAFADKREYAYWLDQSGQNNDWTSNNLTESDISVDSPTNNFATMNPLDMDDSITISEGNLKAIQSGVQHDAIRSTMATSTGKWYFEVRVRDVEDYIMLGLLDTEIDVGSNTYQKTGSWYFTTGGSTYHDNTETNTGLLATAAGDIVQVAYDLDAGKIWWGVNNTWLLSGNPSTGANPVYSDLSGTLAPAGSIYQAANGAIWNFGQDSSFAGNKTAQGNQDSNDIGDFYYTPPNGFLALCSDNLPEPAVTPSEHFNTVLYTGNGSTQSISNVGFQPDWVWLKNRTVARNHGTYDAIRGATKDLMPNNGDPETTRSTGLTAFNSDGFSLSSHSNVNENTADFVSWNWKANGSGSSNSNGSITSTVSANVDSGFSIVSYTGTGSNATVGHGLSKAPEMMIVKDRDQDMHWLVYHKGLTNANYFLKMDNTQPQGNDSTKWNGTDPTSSVFSIGTEVGVNQSGNNYIGYMFHSVEGYSRVGEYIGNTTVNTFIWTGFKPAFVLIKNIVTDGEGFVIMNNKSDPTNVVGTYMMVYQNNAEQGTANTASNRSIDFVSNGFKIRGNSTEINDSGDKHIYIAFAEQPFKNSNAK